MPAVSKAQRITAAIAEHNPSQLYARNRGMASMTLNELHKFASTKSANLPAHVRKAKHPARNLGVHLHPKRGR